MVCNVAGRAGRMLRSRRIMAEIVLTTLNARYVHASFGLRYLLANLGDLQDRAALLEFQIDQRPVDIAEILLAARPRIIGLGVYIWNVGLSTELVSILKRLRPDLTVILGGPEVSFECEEQEIVQLADYVITGEADLVFADVCRELLAGNPPAQKIIAAPVPDLKAIVLPYSFYTDEDIVHRVVYVEASRGCPFTCEFCLSSLDIPVRQFPLEPLLASLDSLCRRGVRQFKFVDRTFNLNLQTSAAILQFFLERLRPGLFLHFEMIPDRLPPALRELISRFPAGSLQFEVGIQTFDSSVSANISRRQDCARLEDNLGFLRRQTGVHIHADLIAGLPGETVESFAAGFDRLVALGPQEIQVGMLKRLRGTPVVRHDAEWGMVYSAEPPYEILQTKTIPFEAMQELRRFSRYWDLVGNSGNFIECTPLLWSPDQSPFAGFMRWSKWLFAKSRRTHGIALDALARFLHQFLTMERGLEPALVEKALQGDWMRTGRGSPPNFGEAGRPEPAASDPIRATPRRQSRHLASPTRK